MLSKRAFFSSFCLSQVVRKHPCRDAMPPPVLGVQVGQQAPAAFLRLRLCQVCADPWKQNHDCCCSVSWTQLVFLYAGSFEDLHRFSDFANWLIPQHLMLGRYPFIEPSRLRYCIASPASNVASNAVGALSMFSTACQFSGLPCHNMPCQLFAKNRVNVC